MLGNSYLCSSGWSWLTSLWRTMQCPGVTSGYVWLQAACILMFKFCPYFAGGLEWMKVATYLGSLAQLCCGEGETLQAEKHCRHVWEALTVDGPHRGCTVQGSIHFPGPSHLCSWLLHEGTNSASQVGHVSRVFNRSKPLGLSGVTCTCLVYFPGPGWSCF